MNETKPYDISKWAVYRAYEQVKANKGCFGVDGQSSEDFEKDLKNNPYKIWNRMSSGSYFPSPVKPYLSPRRTVERVFLEFPQWKTVLLKRRLNCTLSPA